MRTYVSAWLLVCLCGGVAGCGSQQVSTEAYLPVTGKLIRKGKPMSHAEVWFVPASGRQTGGETLSAQADKDGKFQLPLVPEGEYKVHVDIMVKGEPDPKLEVYRTGTPLRATVSPDQTAFEFNIDA